MGRDKKRDPRAIAGKPYTLWFHTPAKGGRASVQVLSESGKEIPSHWEQDGEFASLTFTAMDVLENWSIRF
jgi:hypothetical protein